MGLRFGLYGGAFDPPHRAHVDLAQAFTQAFRLDALFVVPTGNAWHKTTRLTEAAHRLAMAQLAFAQVPGVTVSDMEVRRSGPSYTLDTLRSLQAAQPPAAWYLLMGTDQWARITTWHRWQELLKDATVVVANRIMDNSGGQLKDAEPALPQGLPADAGALPPCSLTWQPRPLSSTDVRRQLAQASTREAALTRLLPPAVAGYISRHSLYLTCSDD